MLAHIHTQYLNVHLLTTAAHSWGLNNTLTNIICYSAFRDSF